MNIRVSTDISLIDKRKWDAFLSGHRNGTVLQSHFMYRLFDASEHFRPVFVYCLDDNDEILGLLLGVKIRESGGIKGFFSSRVVVYGGPLVAETVADNNEVVDLLMDSLVDTVRRDTVFIQFRASYDLKGYGDVFEKHGFRWLPRLNSLIDTTDTATVMAGMSASRRRQVKKSFLNGARIIRPDKVEQVRVFYEILYSLYKFRVKKPLPDWTFFKYFYELTHEQDLGRIFLVEFRGKVVGGIMCPFYPGKAVYEWYVCGLDEEYKSSGIYPSVLATWAAIEFASENNFRIFDFMGVGKPGVPYGVRDFKMKFGGKTVNYGRFIRINNRLLYHVAEAGYNMLAWLKKI
nr:peptidoglycan bridge formation glycyltransferase FemA/FemB family protein [Bacteroidota bacterium]